MCFRKMFDTEESKIATIVYRSIMKSDRTDLCPQNARIEKWEKNDMIPDNQQHQLYILTNNAFKVD